MSKGEAPDNRGLIREAYNIDGISEGECRSIFLDWALGVDGDISQAITVLLERHGAEAEHPMTTVLREGLAPSGKPKRRGGWRSRDR